MLGPEAAGRRPDGLYVRWRWDGARLEAETCETGFLPLFCYVDEELVVLATRLRDLLVRLPARPALDQDALSVFFRLGFFVGNGTPFKNIRILGPNGRLSWRPGWHETSEGYPAVGASSLSRRQAAGAYRDLFRDVMRRICGRVEDKLALTLTGGRDSRHIALELHRNGVLPRFAVTARHLPPRPNEDVRIARQLCDHLGWAHRVVRQPADLYGAERAHIDLADFLSFEHAWTVPIREALIRNNISQTFDGIGGGVLSASAFGDDDAATLAARGDTGTLARRILKNWERPGGEGGLAEICGPELAKATSYEPAFELLKGELDRHLDFPAPLKSFYFWNRARRGTSLLPLKILSDLFCYCPYISRDVREFLLSVDVGFADGKSLHDEAIMLADPDIAGLPYEDKLAAGTPYSTWRTRRYAASLVAAGLSGRGNRLWNPWFVATRSAAAMISGAYPAIDWWRPGRAVYLHRLGKLMADYR